MDLSIIQPRSTASVTGYRVISVASIPLLEVTGVEGYRKVTSVEVNGIRASSVSVLSDSKLHASIPQGVDEVLSVDVYTNDLLPGTYKVSYRLGSSTVSGVDRVAQKVIKVLLTSPGSDIFNPNLGVGLNDLVGKSFSSFGELSSDVALSIRSAESQIKEAELESGLPDSEKLGGIRIYKIAPLHKEGISIDIEVTNRLGEVSRIGVPL